MPWSDAFAAVWPAADNLRRRRAEVTVREDLPYAPGGHPKRRLDLYLPRGEGPFPLVVFLHGGFWKVQDRRFLQGLSGLYGNVGVTLALGGFAAAVLGFRQDSLAHTEEDAGVALTWLRLHAQAHDLDPDRVSLVGHSAGGTLALTLARDPAACGGPIRAVVSLAAVYDLPRLLAAGLRGFRAADAARYFGDDASLTRLSPERHVGRAQPPTLLVTCGDDAPALRAEHVAFVEACGRHDVVHESLDVADVGHMGLVLEVGRRRDRVGPAMTAFLRAHDAPSPAALDARAIGRALFRPTRVKLDAVRATVAGATTVDAAWEALDGAGLLPSAWHDGATRVFSTYVACAKCDGTGHGDHGGPCLACFWARIERSPPTERPRDLVALIALASLPDEILAAAERLAWAYAEALAPWVVPPSWDIPAPRRVCWAVAARVSWRRRRAQTLEPARHARAACLSAGIDVGAIERAIEARLPGVDPCVEQATIDVCEAALWQAAVRAGLRVPVCRDAPEGSALPVGRAFAELPDPTAALCALWRLGVALDGVDPDGTVTLVVAG